MSIEENLKDIKREFGPEVTLVAVSKTHPVEEIMEAYEAGHRDFGENKVQEMMEKKPQLPGDIRWHMVGHLQSNKVKYIAPFIYLIHGVDKPKLLRVIDKEGRKKGRVIDCLLQVHIAREETKFGFEEAELREYLDSGQLRDLSRVRVRGLMGMATFTENEEQVKREFAFLSDLFNRLSEDYFVEEDRFDILSMGMSDDYELAIETGSNMVRIGTRIFGPREYCKTQ